MLSHCLCCQGANLDSLRKQYVSINTELSLQPLLFLKINILGQYADRFDHGIFICVCHYTLLSFFFACCFLSTASLPSLPPSFSQFNTLSVSLGHSSHSPLSASHLPQDLFLSPMSPLSSVTYKHTHPILVDSSQEKRCDIFLNLFLLLLDVVISICVNFPAKIMISVFLTSV